MLLYLYNNVYSSIVITSRFIVIYNLSMLNIVVFIVLFKEGS